MAVPINSFSMNSMKDPEKTSVIDDFMYGSNVASAHIYIRMGFLRKVYGILTAQLLVTTLTAAFFILHEPTKLFVQKNQWMLLIALFATFGVMMVLTLKRRETPTNYILLFVFTALEAYTVGVIVTFYHVSLVLEAFALTCAVTFGLSIYTLQSKRDFSKLGAGLFSVLWIIILAGLLQIFFQSEMLDKLLAIGGAIVFSLFIVFDTHMMMHKLSAEEYIVASINLYLDIINLFLYILRILNDNRK
ncbi:protein lifeguard 4 [Octopus bimaculoides]|uniref:Transmembrane BAX inhibitor motif-containing protein 4 n=1 Tax=Octopus bimaculoides TaxID=37653 RepID=A0A0L8FNU1_OCTBM|nr:protein lifeguard 4 [Octopus bimaculoides]XP_014788211.1 protein lifeguard 4 [Octopus bimaculoides]XP_014788212.1 protein lifeguard 4 [Octopus bimaculoides]XP_052825066.1 protein lifeguard 4 [Octopus bimaculoides]XP_052825067.1 protein lifeguard 4 [Octopus bimaculoides]|eukprot:XP_014788210.1 PREDICTED: protein lifeguard 4-like [Octopus bimaculoides]